MTRDRLVSVFVVLVAVAVGIVVLWLAAFRHPRTVTRSTPTTVLVAPPETPLRDSIREPAKKKSGSRKKATGSYANHVSQSTPENKVGISPSKAPKATTGLPKRQKRKTTTSPSKPASQPTGTSTQPQSPSQQPGVTVPLPSVCLPPLKVNC